MGAMGTGLGKKRKGREGEGRGEKGREMSQREDRERSGYVQGTARC